MDAPPAGVAAQPVLKTHTLGCKVNQYETQWVREALLSVGYRDAQGAEEADLCLVNTCTVTAEGDAKSRQVIRRLARQNTAARILVMGCYATRAPEELRRLPGVAEVITDKRELPDLLGRFGVIDVPTGIRGFRNRHRAYVKIQDGCLLRCSYCVIPLVRPHVWSRSVPEIREEVVRLQAGGYREIVLTGIHVGHYGVDKNWRRPKADWLRLSDLLRELVRLPGDFRIRLSSIEATEVTRELIRVIADHPNRVCPHLHVCLQSGSDAVLRRMRRRWGARRFLDRCLLLRDQLDEPALTTDVVVGFPGETDDDFRQTCAVAREVGFSKIHCFPFSARRGTAAAGFRDQVPGPVKAARSREVAALESELRRQYLQRLVGRQLRVLVESPVHDAPGVIGTACRYVPVQIVNVPETWTGRLVDVAIRGTGGDRLLAACPETPSPGEGRRT
jgi:threonylcarbamoyladenosine tRNA methylthiotransferase MtaB